MTQPSQAVDLLRQAAERQRAQREAIKQASADIAKERAEAVREESVATETQP